MKHIHEKHIGTIENHSWEYTAYEGEYRNSDILGTLKSNNRLKKSDLLRWMGDYVTIHTDANTSPHLGANR